MIDIISDFTWPVDVCVWIYQTDQINFSSTAKLPQIPSSLSMHAIRKLRWLWFAGHSGVCVWFSSSLDCGFFLVWGALSASCVVFWNYGWAGSGWGGRASVFQLATTTSSKVRDWCTWFSCQIFDFQLVWCSPSSHPGQQSSVTNSHSGSHSLS